MSRIAQLALFAAIALPAQDDANRLFKARVYVPAAGRSRAAPELLCRIMLVTDRKAPVAAPPDYRFKAGEKFKLEVRPPLAGFVYILQDDADPSQRTLLFPVTGSQSPVEADRLLLLPHDVSFRVPAGTRPFSMYVVVSAAPLSELTHRPLDVRQAVNQIRARVPGDRSIALQEIAVALR